MKRGLKIVSLLVATIMFTLPLYGCDWFDKKYETTDVLAKYNAIVSKYSSDEVETNNLFNADSGNVIDIIFQANVSGIQMNSNPDAEDMLDGLNIYGDLLNSLMLTTYEYMDNVDGIVIEEVPKDVSTNVYNKLYNLDEALDEFKTDKIAFESYITELGVNAKLTEGVKLKFEGLIVSYENVIKEAAIYSRAFNDMIFKYYVNEFSTTGAGADIPAGYLRQLVYVGQTYLATSVYYTDMIYGEGLFATTINNENPEFSSFTITKSNRLTNLLSINGAIKEVNNSANAGALSWDEFNSYAEYSEVGNAYNEFRLREPYINKALDIIVSATNSYLEASSGDKPVYGKVIEQSATIVDEISSNVVVFANAVDAIVNPPAEG